MKEGTTTVAVEERKEFRGRPEVHVKRGGCDYADSDGFHSTTFEHILLDRPLWNSTLWVARIGVSLPAKRKPIPREPDYSSPSYTRMLVGSDEESVSG